MSYRKLDRDHGVIAVCDACKFSVGAGITKTTPWVEYLRRDGWLVFKRRGQPKQCWCVKSECQTAGKQFLAEFEKATKEQRAAQQREARRERRAMEKARAEKSVAA